MPRIIWPPGKLVPWTRSQDDRDGTPPKCPRTTHAYWLRVPEDHLGRRPDPLLRDILRGVSQPPRDTKLGELREDF